MKGLTSATWSSTAYGGLIEKIEIIRSSLRWATRLERQDIQRILKQCTELRDEVMLLSRKERFVQASASIKERTQRSTQERRQALVERNFVFEGVFGESPRLLEALEIAEKAAPTDLPVLIEGESGTGKELMARLIHTNSRRSPGPFVSINCGAIPDDLLESELFGHKKGAFTGAANDRKGKFESANGGTIFLDEIGELSLQGQVKLLRVLQSQEIQRVGSDDVINVDTRVVAATNRDLYAMSREERFREDLYYRLGVIQVTVPALRHRQDEIPLLIEYFCDEAAEKLERAPIKLTSRLRDYLLHYAYPGNIRELRNIVFRLTCLADGMADLLHLPRNMQPEGVNLHAEPSQASDRMPSLVAIKKAASDAAEKRYLQNGLRELRGNVTELAKHLELNRSHLQTLLKKHGLHSKDYRAAREKNEKRASQDA